MSGPEMLMQAAFKAFMPKETAEKIQITIEGMLKDGTLDGIGSLVSDIAEIKRSQARIEFGLARIFAGLSLEQQIHSGGEKDRVSGDTGTGPVNALVAEQQPRLIAGPGSGGDAGSEPDGVRGGDVEADRRFGQPHFGHDRDDDGHERTDRQTGEAAE
jgi:hypothetical protein